MNSSKPLKYKIGIFLIVISCIMPLFAFIVPFLGFSMSVTALITAAFVVGTPELLFFIGIALAGKEAVTLVKQKLLKPAGQMRYNIGLVIFCTSFFANWICAYLEVTSILQIGIHGKLYLMVILDLILISSVFLMGPEFFIKIKNIFSWDGGQNDR